MEVPVRFGSAHARRVPDRREVEGFLALEIRIERMTARNRTDRSAARRRLHHAWWASIRYLLGSSGISGKHWVRCNEGYDPWIVRLGSADESDTLMKTRTRRGQDRQNKVFACYPGWARCVLFCPRLHERSTLPVGGCVCFRWTLHAAFPGNS